MNDENMNKENSKNKLVAYNDGVQDERTRCKELVRFCINNWIQQGMFEGDDTALVMLEVIEDAIGNGQRIPKDKAPDYQ